MPMQYDRRRRNVSYPIFGLAAPTPGNGGGATGVMRPDFAGETTIGHGMSVAPGSYGAECASNAMNAPFFSVISVCRNAESVLGATAESLRMQGFTDYEWIVVDGDSTDNTCDIARKYLDAKRDMIVSEPDDGVYFAMNKGLRLARAEFVLFLNAGDVIADVGTLALVRETIDNNVDVLHGDAMFQLPRGDLIYRRSKDASGGVDRRLLASHQSVYVRRELHLCHPFDTSLRISADFAMLAALHSSGARFRYFPVALSVTTLEPDAISMKGRPRMAWEDIRVNRGILGMSRLRAYAIYLAARMRIGVVSILKALPAWAFRLLPARLRRRVY